MARGYKKAIKTSSAPSVGLMPGNVPMPPRGTIPDNGDFGMVTTPRAVGLSMLNEPIIGS